MYYYRHIMTVLEAAAARCYDNTIISTTRTSAVENVFFTFIFYTVLYACFLGRARGSRAISTDDSDVSRAVERAVSQTNRTYSLAIFTL